MVLQRPRPHLLRNQELGNQRESGQTHPAGRKVKRQNGAAGGLDATAAASTQAQFQNSIAHLRGRISNPVNSTMNNPQAQPARRTPEPEPTFVQKVMKALCCG
ncbi:hypothetical protein CIHG_06561 [Coccidioides immitis H538.4]|uniref:Uncharacterized protein n=1 Tax=Coccidioides immitis H538.4 TaxID=396776 RepID=A0A0J8UM45_COCIT|nr:hypothetical protein CIHG_06561 [Coccidioides immitis H538.4]